MYRTYLKMTILWPVSHGTSQQMVHTYILEIPQYIMYNQLLVLTDHRGNWTETGCNLTALNEENGTATCSCNHLTNFAVLVVRQILTYLFTI